MDGRSIDVIIGGDARMGIIGVRIWRMYEVRMMSDALLKEHVPVVP